MSRWSREQSQAMGACRGMSSGPKVKSLGNLIPLSEKQKAQRRRELGLKKPFSSDVERSAEIKKTRDYLCPVKVGYVPPKPRGRSHVVMGGKARAAMAERSAAREAFFRSL